LRHSIADVDDDGRARVTARELRRLVDVLPIVMRDSRRKAECALANRLWTASGEPGWRPSPSDLLAMRHLCIAFASDTEKR
jgi:hypothetical protein